MTARFTFLSGARAGRVETFRNAYIGLGRHPLSDIRFDAERDLDVSSRHAAVIRHGDPVAIIGYPLGEDLPMERLGSGVIADPTLTVGTVSKVLSNLVQVDGYGAPGSSGSRSSTATGASPACSTAGTASRRGGSPTRYPQLRSWRTCTSSIPQTSRHAPWVARKRSERP